VESWDSEAVRAVLAAHKELEPQPDHLQSDLKVSFFGNNLDETFLAHLRRQYADLGHAVVIVYSSEQDLDVLPANTNKGTAAAHLADHWQIDPERVTVAGDSGNDRAMFEQTFRGIVVGNAKPELRALTGPNIYHATGHFAAGVLEGLRYWSANANK
jgi:sucrose-6F-phosphate phosphohydrolase